MYGFCLFFINRWQRNLFWRIYLIVPVFIIHPLSLERLLLCQHIVTVWQIWGDSVEILHVLSISLYAACSQRRHILINAPAFFRIPGNGIKRVQIIEKKRFQIFLRLQNCRI